MSIFIIITLLIVIAILLKIIYDKNKKIQSLQLQSTSLSAKSPTDLNVYGIDGNPKEWILLVKLGEGGQNCKTCGDNCHSCHYLYADSSNSNLRLINDHAINDANEQNPLYKTWSQAKNNNFVSWNDGQENWTGTPKHSCNGTSGWAHDKGFVIYNQNQAVYCQHSCPNWGFKNYWTSPPEAKEMPGIQTHLAQHFFLMKLNSKEEIDKLVKVMNYANVCVNEGKIDNFVKFGGTTLPKTFLNLEKVNINGIEIVAKGRGEPGNDIWGSLQQDYCNKQNKIYNWSFCVPRCPQGNKESTDSINNVVDVMNFRKNGLNTNCENLKFDQFKSNHCKIGVCENNDTVIIGGNNHSILSQGPRGGLFIVLHNKQLAMAFKCLFIS